MNTLINNINAHRNILITGQAGTGKSFLINKLKKYLEQSDINYGLTSTTGISANNINGKTLHSFFSLAIANNIREYSNLKHFGWKYVKKRIMETDIIIIDEVSMLSSDLLELVNHVLVKATGQQHLPFGGKQVIFVGDFLQLPPVSGDYAFNTPIWKNLNLIVYNLEKVHRQDDPEFIGHLNNIRKGTITPDLKEYIKKLETNTFDITPVKLFATNANVDSMNIEELNKIEGPSTIYKWSTWGGKDNVDKFSKNLITQENLELKIGARVMAIANDDTVSIYNGKLGTVTGLNTGSVKVLFDDGLERTLAYNRWEQLDGNGKKKCHIDQIPLKLAYAITIHKSQGMTIDGLEINCDGIFADSQFYVAISRAKNANNLRIVNFEEDMIRVNKEAVDFYARLK